MSDIFWARRTEDAGGLIRLDSELPSVASWRRLRLSQELTDRHYRRFGLVPQPSPTKDSADIVLLTGDCFHTCRTFGHLADDIHLDNSKTGALWADLVPEGRPVPYPDGYGWAKWVDEVERRLGLPTLAVAGRHDKCPHATADAALPLMWQVGLLLRTAGDDPGDTIRALHTMTFEDAVQRVGAVYETEDHHGATGRWVVLRTRTQCCALSPTGLAYCGDTIVDLAARHRAGASIGELATLVEDMLADEQLNAEGRRWQHLMRLTSRAGLPTARMLPEIETPEEVMFFASDDELTVVADLDASPATADAALAYGLALAHNRDLTLILPAGRQHPTLRRAPFLNIRAKVWLHDGYRVMPTPLPPRDEIYDEYRAQSWSVLPPDHPWPPEHTRLLDPNTQIRVRRMTRSGPATVVFTAETLPLHHHTITEPRPTAVLEALDDMVWAEAAADELAAVVKDIDSYVFHRILIGSPDGKALLDPLYPAQLEALDLGAARLKLFDGYATDHAETATYGTAPICTAPTTRPRPTPPRSSNSRRQHISELAATAGAINDPWPDPARALLPPAWNAYAATQEHDAIADDFADVISAQAFAMNVFAPIGADGATRICKNLALPINRADPPVFGYRADENLLRESDDRTEADVLLTGTTADGRRVAAVLLVRLTEEELGRCPGYHDPANLRRDTCHTNAPFGGDQHTCHLLRGQASALPPIYADLLDRTQHSPPSANGWWVPDGGCPFRRSNAPMRALALGEALRTRHRYDHVAVALCTPAFEETAQRRWREMQAMLRSASGITPSYLPIEIVLAITDHPAADWVRERYALGNAEIVGK